MRVLLLGLFAFTFLWAYELQLLPEEKVWIEKHQEVNFTGDPNWLPFEAIDSDGNYIGIVADYLKLVEKKTGFRFKLKPVKNWSETLDVASKGEVSVISGDIADKVLKENYKPVTPYLINPIIILMRDEADYVEDLALLRDKKIAIIKGYGYSAEIFQNYPSMKFIEVETVQKALLGVASKKYDAMLASIGMARYSLSSMELDTIKIVGKSSVVMEVTLFVDKNEPILHAIIDKAIKSITLQEQEKILNRWQAQRAKDESTYTLLWMGLLSLFLLLTLSILMLRRLQKSKAYYKHALVDSYDALWSWDIIKDEISFSEGAKDMMGLKKGLFSSGMDVWYEHMHLDDKKSAKALLEENIRCDIGDFSAEYRMRHKDGHWIWVKVQVKVICDVKDKPLRMDGFCTDITEQKEHFLAGEENTRRLESAQEIGHLGSWDWNIKTGSVNWSDEVYRIFGEEPQSFSATYEAIMSYIPQEYQKGLEAAIAEAIQCRKPYEYDHEILRKDGKRRLVRGAGYVIFDEKGEAQYMFGTILDIDTISEASITRRENRELNELLEKFDENVIASNTDLLGVITYASEALSKISGYTNEELVGSEHNILRHKDMWKTIQRGETWQGEIKNRKKDGGFYWVYNTISPIIGDTGETIGYSAIRQDLTHEKEAEALHKSLELKTEELMTLNKELEYRVDLAVLSSKDKDHLMAQQSKLASMGEMIGNIAHQWRQPLNALGLLLQKQQVFLERGLLTSEKMETSVAKGTALIRKMSTTIDDFRDFFKPNKEKVVFDVKMAIEDTLALIDAALYDHNISLELLLEKDQMIFGYKNEFSQVILNLINNAKDVLSDLNVENPLIRLKNYTKDDEIIVEVYDNGGGINQAIMEQIFEPYFTTKEEGKGTGIGLYMSKMIIEENMDGKLSVINADDGALFTVSVPAYHEEEM